MNIRSIDIRALLAIISLLLFVSGCGTQMDLRHDYFSFVGESKRWKLEGYQMEITPDSFAAGSGILHMKGTDEYHTDFFSFYTTVMIGNKEQRVHGGSVSGHGGNIAEHSIGTVDGGPYLNEEGEPVTREDIEKVYMVVKWWDVNQHKNVEERIELWHD
ncbi:hypothetical protein [Desertibacillus haloalkaliphilus]|uniref:hypothetical protein n=1 Tax=Desertibacillus haloalkaliphilus TaxID=1328930 RepID=UPI001C261E6B|nr:hypothetical protein [Desertibacillus haloalkaliphilus]MBU8906811.1 hypothetical protein [Desertibacillus haloalkaliphilus]